MKRVLKYSICFLLGITALVACKKDEIMIFDSANNAVNFPKYYSPDKLYTYNYSFLSNPNDSKVILDVPVKLIGLPSTIDREVKVQVVNEGTTANIIDYKIIGGVIPANAYEGKISIEVKNTPELTTVDRILVIKIIPSAALKAGTNDEISAKIVWNNRLLALTGSQLTRFRYTFCNTYSTKAYRLALAVSGLKPATFPIQGTEASVAYGIKYRDSVNRWNLQNPDKILLHDDGTKAGTPIIPYYK